MTLKFPFRSRVLCRFLSVGLSTCIVTTMVPHMEAQSTSSPEAIYYNGNILTGVGLLSSHPERVSAIAVTGHTILATGSDSAVLERKRAHTELFDLHGAFVMPGVNDAHVHLGEAGRTKLAINLTGSASLDDMLNRIRKAAAAADQGQWLLGGGWDHTLWVNKVLPTKQQLDIVTGGHPAIFSRIDGHIAIANTAALNAAGISAQTPDPPGGRFDHDASGALTGIVREDPAEELIWKHVPPPSRDMRERALALALADAVANGVTSVQDNSPWDDFLVFEQFEHAGKLPVRVSEWLKFDEPVAVLQAQRASHPSSDRMLHTGMLKGFMDGSLGSRTAALKLPYADDPGNSGIPRYDQNRLNQMTIERTQAGFQIGFHAIGDRAIHMALDAFAAAEGEVDATGSHSPFVSMRDRIEHSQVIDPDDISRYKKLGIIASMQPSHLLTDMNWAEARLGVERARYSYTWKDFLDAGVPLAFGTDYPVEPINPFRGIYSAVTRSNEAGTKNYFPQDKLTIEQALFAYTQGSAYAEFADSYKGKLAPGYVADFIILDRDLIRVAPRDILSTKVLRTVVDGQTVYQAGAKIR